MEFSFGWGEIISILSFIVLLAAGYAAVRERIKSVEEKCKKIPNNAKSIEIIEDDIKTIKDDLKEVKVKNDVFWKILEPHLAGIIHSPIHHRRDFLVDQLVMGKIDKEEAIELKIHLNEEVSRGQGDKRLAALLLLARVEQMTVTWGNNNHHRG